MDRLLLLLLLLIAWAAAAAAAAEEEDVEWSVICAFGRLELEDDEDDVYEEWREGDEVAEAGDEGRKTARKKMK